MKKSAFMKVHLEFKNKHTEEKYRIYNFKRRRGVLHMQHFVVGFFSFLGIFHLIYLQPKNNELTPLQYVYVFIAVVGIIMSIVLGYFSKVRHSDLIILVTNLLINFILIEPNFLEIAEFTKIRKIGYFWLGFRISSINLITLLCYNSFLYKTFQTTATLLYLIVRMSKDANLHNVLVDTGIGILICAYFYSQERGERLTYMELHEIMEEKKSWKHFLNFLPEGIAIFTKDFNCTFMNESVKNIFTVTDKEELKGKIFNLDQMNAEQGEMLDSKFSGRAENLKDYFNLFYAKSLKRRESTRIRPAGIPNKNRLLDTGKSLQTEGTTNYHDAFFSEYNKKFLCLKLTLIDFEKNDSILVHVSDISLSIKSHVLEENRKFRDMLFASFSHEIRTPLNCILLLLGKLMKGSYIIPEKILKKYVYPSYYSGQILLHLVNDILDYSFLVRDELKLNISEIDIKAECLEIMEVISMQAKLKGVNLFLKLDRNLPKIIQTDASRLKQVLCHLLLNALKYTVEGKITLKLLSTTELENGITVTVKDTGLGMNQEEQKRLEEKLRMASLSTMKVTKNAAGASLRTLLSQSLAKMIGFKGGKGITFYSRQSLGSMFGFTVQNHSDNTLLKLPRKLSESQRVYKVDERQKSGIVIKWVSAYKSSTKCREISPLNSTESIGNLPPQSNFARKSLGDLDFLEDNMKRINNIDDEELDSIITEFGESKKVLPDFDEIVISKQKSKRIKAEINYKLQKEKAPSSTNLQSPRNTKFVAPCNHPKILVVDDDEFNILAMKSILKQKSFSICTARNGQQAIELVHNELISRKDCCKKFQLILMDVNMPVMGGLEATRLLKLEMKEEKVPWMPIVGCTAFVGSNDEAICRQNGMDDYETKPFNEKKITRILQKWAYEVTFDQYTLK